MAASTGCYTTGVSMNDSACTLNRSRDYRSAAIARSRMVESEDGLSDGWLARLKLNVPDASGEMEVTVWENTIQITEIGLSDFVAVHLQGDSELMLRRLVGGQWTLSLSRQKLELGYREGGACRQCN
ncbi:hypothetical protein R1sor_003283 [Riccia sorocarpa]|uniref:Uncharacterized protein n=1 Tax=Riccia sorocarpa TaxID=122646 RepID=A0ABD3H3B1_9MARC